MFKAWATPELFQRWWAPGSFGLKIISYEADVRTGGAYRLVMTHTAAEQPMAFFGKYIEVIPNARLVWTNEEGDDEGAVTTVTFEDKGDVTLVVVHELYPSKEALEEAMGSGPARAGRSSSGNWKRLSPGWAAARRWLRTGRGLLPPRSACQMARGPAYRRG